VRVRASRAQVLRGRLAFFSCGIRKSPRFWLQTCESRYFSCGIREHPRFSIELELEGKETFDFAAEPPKRIQLILQNMKCRATVEPGGCSFPPWSAQAERHGAPCFKNNARHHYRRQKRRARLRPRGDSPSRASRRSREIHDRNHNVFVFEREPHDRIY